jgi:uncharacterized protein (DUF1810 family)
MISTTQEHDPFNLGRFVDAQRANYEQACGELRDGRKRSHWIWYVFPQLKGLGHSATSQFYGLDSLAEARAYLAHPVLGQRLKEATRLVLSHAGKSLQTMLGSPDDMKFRSSMTLFARASAPGSLFDEALAAFCDGKGDEKTIALL